MKTLRPFTGSRTARIAAVSISALTFAAAAALPAAASGTPTGVYSGMGTCPLGSSTMQSTSNALVGCMVSVVNGGTITIGGTTVAIPSSSPITVTFGTYWQNNGPVASFPDGTSADVMSTVAPTGGAELTASPLDVPIPGISNFWPGVTSAIVQVELAGPVTNFTPLALGESYPVFQLPIKLHVENVFLGDDCYIGTNSHPIVLQPMTGTTNPPAPNTPITGNPGTLNFYSDPNGYGDTVVGFSGTKLVDNSFSVPGATGCGLLGSEDWIVDSLFGLGSAAGKNTVEFDNVNTMLAMDTSASDLSSAIAASAN